MPTLAPPPQHHAMVWDIRSLTKDSSCGNGVEASRLLRLAEEAKEHWSERAELLVASIGSDESSYESVPLVPKSVVRVRYRFVGPLKPRRLASDD